MLESAGCCAQAVSGDRRHKGNLHVQVADGVPAARRKGGRVMPPPLPLRVKQPGVRYFHSRSCIPMMRQEAEASMDSDDEPDTEAWQVGDAGHPPATAQDEPLHASGLLPLHACRNGNREFTS